jgi:hypothetical protein
MDNLESIIFDIDGTTILDKVRQKYSKQLINTKNKCFRVTYQTSEKGDECIHFFFNDLCISFRKCWWVPTHDFDTIEYLINHNLDLKTLHIIKHSQLSHIDSFAKNHPKLKNIINSTLNINYNKETKKTHIVTVYDREDYENIIQHKDILICKLEDRIETIYYEYDDRLDAYKDRLEENDKLKEEIIKLFISNKQEKDDAIKLIDSISKNKSENFLNSEQEIFKLKCDISDLKFEINGLENEIDELKDEINKLKLELKNTKEENQILIENAEEVILLVPK